MLIAVLATVALVLAACGGGSSATTDGDQGSLRVVTTTSILADFARNAGGEAVQVEALIAPGVDVHTFQSSPKDSGTIREAKVIVMNGVGLDDFLKPVIDGAKWSKAVVVTASKGLTPRKHGASEEFDEDEEGGDPHFWQNPQHVVRYVENIRDALIKADGSRSDRYRQNTAAYIDKLTKLDSEIESALKAIPSERRHLITFHDAFGYFADRYGFKVSSFLPTSGGDLSPGAVAKIVDLVKKERIPAVFAEPQFKQDVLRQVARDTNAAIGVIVSDAFTDQAPTYIDMMRANAKSLASLLGNAPSPR